MVCFLLLHSHSHSSLSSSLIPYVFIFSYSYSYRYGRGLFLDAQKLIFHDTTISDWSYFRLLTPSPHFSASSSYRTTLIFINYFIFSSSVLFFCYFFFFLFRTIAFDMPNPRSFTLPFEQRYLQLLLDPNHPFIVS